MFFLYLFIQGLNDEQVLENRVKFGSNVLCSPPKKSNLRKFQSSLVGGLNALLLGSAVLSLAIYGIQQVYDNETSNDDVSAYVNT